MTHDFAETWLDREDTTCSPARRARLEWLASLTPECEFLIFPGWVGKYLFEELRYCFVYGQFMATVVLGLAFVERRLAADFYAAGRSDLERASITVLLRESLEAGWLTREEHGQLDEIRTLRNPLTHFRAPLSTGTVERRSVITEQVPYDILEGDARKVIVAVFHLLQKNGGLARA